MKRSQLLLATVLFYCSGLTVIAAESDVIVLDATLGEVDPSKHISFLLDSTSLLSLSDVIDAELSPLNRDTINFGFTTDKIWLRFSVRNSASEALSPLLRTSARFMRPLEVFIVRSSGSIEQLIYNDETQAFGQRPLPELRFLATEFTLAAAEQADIYIRFGAGGQAAMTLQLSGREQALVEQYRAEIGIAIYAVILLTLVLVNFFHFLAVRKLAYLVYVFYESFNVLYVAHLEGFTFQYLWPNLPQWNDDATPMIAALGIMIGNFFAMVFLETKKYTPALHRVFLGIISLAAAVLLLTIAVGNSIGNQLTAPMLPISLLLSVVAAALAMRRGHYLARYFLVAWSLFAVVAAIWSGTILGLFDASYNALTLYKVAIAAQAIILSMGLADQVRRINNEYARTQLELIENLEGRLEDARERLQLEHENENAALQLLQKSKQHAATSHDVNQPIQSLRLALAALRKTTDTEATLHLESILDHMQSVLGGALNEASADLEESTRRSAIQSLVVGNLIADVLAQFAPQAAEKNLKLKGFDSKAIIVSRELPLKRCLMNLVANGINNTFAGGVLLGVRRRKRQMLFQVVDTGRGIAENEVDSILQPMHKGIESVGHGLGLAIVSEICAEYDWEFSIESKLGSGSIFTIAVPVRG